jgi:FtsH-binding integral membrane protein
MIDAEHRSLHAPRIKTAAEFDLGLRAFLLRVIGQAALGLLLAGGVAYLVAAFPGGREHLVRVQDVAGVKQYGLTGLGLTLMVSPIAALLAFGAGVQTRLRSAVLFWSFAATIGASMSVLVLAYAGLSVATAFAAAAAGFGACCLYGYTTKRDLTAAGAFFTTGLVGLLAAMALNLVFASPGLGFAITMMGVVVFSGLVAYDLQRLKMIYGHAQTTGASLDVATNTGALCLFLDFVNLFQFMLMAMGQRR